MVLIALFVWTVWICCRRRFSKAELSQNVVVNLEHMASTSQRAPLPGSADVFATNNAYEAGKLVHALCG